MSHHHALSLLQQSLEGLRAGTMPLPAFCAAWRGQTGLLAELPPRYAQVMEDLLGRLESGSLFTEESCSFSQEDLLAGLQTWLQKARGALPA